MSLITPFDPWNSELCSCPKKYSLSAYTGCDHGCLYCYASSYIRDFTKVRPKKDFLIRLKREIKKIPPGSIITMANSSDPYLLLEKELKLTRQALQILLGYDLNINIVTKSGLITRDLDLLKGFKKIVVCISLTTLDNKLAKKIEPHGPSPKIRIKTISTLSRHIPVAVRLDPLIYPLNLADVEKTIKIIKEAGAKQIITSTYKVKPDNFKRMLGSFPEHKLLWEKLYLKYGERKGGYIYLSQEIRKELITQIRKISLDQKMQFSSCREGFAQLNTATCDGTQLVRSQ